METKEINAVNRGDNQPDECEVCCNLFDHTRRPRTLPCGHSFCSSCVANLISDCHVSCPSCRDRHYAKCVTQFPVNYGMEALIQKLNPVQSTGKPQLQCSLREAQSSVNSRLRHNRVSGTDRLRHLAKEQSDLVQKLPAAYSEMEMILTKHKIQVLAHQNALKEQLDKLDHSQLQEQGVSTGDLTRDVRAAAELLEKRSDLLCALIQEGQEKCREAASMMDSPNLDPSPEEMANVIAEADRYISAKDEWLRSCHAVILDNEASSETEKLLAKVHEALRVTALASDSQQSDNSSSFTVENSLDKSEMKSLLTTHLVYALQRKEGNDRFARVTLGENGIYLHHLQDEPPPDGARIVQFTDVYKLVNNSSLLAFMNFGWNDSDLGRLHIRLQPDTARARQFALLCTGLLGPSYAGTRLLSVDNRGLPSEYVRGGDYQYNNGTGGASLLPGLRRGGEYWRQQLPGSVMAPGSWGDACSAQFIISTRNPGLAQRDDTIYGQVEDGLHILTAAIRDTRIAEVKVVDCGIVIPL